MSDASSAPDAGPQVSDAVPPAAAAPVVLPVARLPRPGDLTLGWRAVTAGVWIGVVVCIAAVWSASVQLGLSTWWLGPRSDPQARFIQFSPFVPPVLMLLATINHLRWSGWWGLAAAAVLGGFGVGDLGRVPVLAAVELAIAAAAGVASVASLSGTYRAPAPDAG